MVVVASRISGVYTRSREGRGRGGEESRGGRGRFWDSLVTRHDRCHVRCNAGGDGAGDDAGGVCGAGGVDGPPAANAAPRRGGQEGLDDVQHELEVRKGGGRQARAVAGMRRRDKGGFKETGR